MKINDGKWLCWDDWTEFASVRYGSLSLSTDGELCYGNDGVLREETRALSPEQRAQLAAYMVQQWAKWGGLPAE